MKKLFFFIVVLACVLPVFSQAQYKHKPGLKPKASPVAMSKERFYSMVHEMLRKQSAAATQPFTMPNAKTTTTMERLIGASSYNYYDTTLSPLGRADTTYLKYSSGRGSFFNFNDMGYDNFWFNSGAFIYGGNSKDYSGVSYNDQPPVLSDTCFTWYRYDLYPNDTTNLQYAYYDANCNATEFATLYNMDATMSYPLNRSFNYYDTLGYISSSYILNWDYGTWDTIEHRTYYYDVNHKIIKDSSVFYQGGGLWSPEYNWTYYYNSYGKFSSVLQFYYNDTSASWDTVGSYTYTYYTDSTVKTATVKIKDFITTILQPIYIDSLGYTSGVKYVTYEKLSTYTYDTSGINYLEGYDIYTKHIASGLPDTLYSSSYTTLPTHLQQKSKSVVYYDSYNLPTLSNTYMWDTAHNKYDTTIDYIEHYYYEAFTPSAAFLARALGWVLDVPQTGVVKNASIKVYPNPVSSQLYIDGASRGTSIRIFNMLGVLVYNSVSENELEAINMQNLSPGVYAVELTDKDGLRQTKTIVKQ